MRSSTFFRWAKKEYKIETPWLNIDTSRLYSVLKCSTNCASVMSPRFTSRLSHAVQFHSFPFRIAFVFAGGVGSLMVMKGTARLMKPFFNTSTAVNFQKEDK